MVCKVNVKMMLSSKVVSFCFAAWMKRLGKQFNLY